MMGNSFLKDPAAVLDYKFDWSDWLAAGETIASMALTVPTGITLDASSLTDGNTSVTVWLSGGTVNSNYTVHCKIVTDSVPPRTDERDMVIKARYR